MTPYMVTVMSLQSIVLWGSPKYLGRGLYFWNDTRLCGMISSLNLPRHFLSMIEFIVYLYSSLTS